MSWRVVVLHACRNMQPSKIPYRSFFRIIILSTTLFTFSIAARDTITPTQPLADNETLVSSDGSFALGFFTPSATASRYVGIWYNKIPSRDIVWVANRGNPVIDSAGQLSVAANGTLIITDQKSTAVVWSAAGDPTAGLVSPVAQLLDNGNFVVKGGDGGNGSYAWQGFDHPTDTLLPGMKLGVDRTTGLNRTLTAWKSKNDPSPGEFYAAVDIRGDPEVYLWAGSNKQWRSGPSVGIGASGSADRGFSVRFVDNDQEVAYSQVVTDKSIVSRVVVNQSGLIQHALWSWETSQWNISWYAPSGKCDAVGECGTYGVCNANDSPALCQCLQGFVPSNQREWDLRNWGDGCVRSTNLTCTNGTTDGFMVVPGVKLPVSSNAVVNMSLSLDECEAKCLKNCSCTAYASANISSADGKGCVMWVEELLDISKVSTSGRNLYVRLSAGDLASGKRKTLWSRASWPLFVATCDLLLVLLTIYLTCVFRRIWNRRRRRRATPYAINFFNEQFDEGGTGNDFDLPILDFATVEAATDYFSTANKLGEGGYGPVYKGVLSDGQEIAVKRLAKTSLQGTEEFKNEVILIAKLQNRNLVRLLGCCIEREERLLIYEYMINKSLDAFLFGKEVPPLDWQTRYRIILGITRGLLYLHHDSRFRIIHRDMKASNILLDKDMNPKISDFGMARILGGDETNINTKKVVGTYGYMSPEYALDGIFSLKSDVYSFGVLVLEIISGKKNRGSSPFSPQLNLVSHAWSLWIERKGLELVDESLNYTVAVKEVLNCIKVGLLCVQERPEDRPLMSSVILMLGSDIATLPEPKQPGFVTRVFPLQVDENVNMHEVYASNHLSASLVGR
ncbi:receptor-like serine/threonine-protein kinase SD1-8 [Iris pallida]|uniref:Receptor-like serine/threonine-protein kinase n=1 Tax=Iris pallida TaxID=29817 RepID=A0AAX6HST0_IRIPA|nr:receptor-like serine/threonine-protein kinase SD1-8 [Iris pallida]